MGKLGGVLERREAVAWVYYCPPSCGTKVERNQFINNLQNYLMTSKEIILGGDFNCIENLELDKWEEM